jgi:MYXO-CTERM domain-containing protein
MRSSSRVSLVLVAAAGLLTAQAASAAPVSRTPAKQPSLDPAEGVLKITAAAGVAGTPRRVRGIQWQRPVVTSSTMSAVAASASAPPAPDPWSRFVHQRGGSWQSAWDLATQTPVRVWGEGLAAPGSMASPAAAERFALQVLADHLELWAPGTQVSDYRLVSNHTDGDIRTLGFAQTYRGLDVVGGQMSFRFKRDRLVVIAAEAIPNLSVEVPRRSRISATQLGSMRARIGQGLAALGLPAAAKVEPAGSAQPLILPIIGDAAVLGARVVVPFHVEGAAAGRWLLYADAETGETVGFESLTFYAQGKLLYRVAPRHPNAGRENRPVNRMNVLVNGTAALSAVDGTIFWAGDAAQNLTPMVTGQLVTVVNKAGALATTTLTLQPNGQAVWDATADATTDAQLNVAVHIGEVKEYVRAFAPAMPTLDSAITTNVNIDMECNASFDGKDLNFFRSSTRCQNTGLLADVVYHEFGHAMHFHSIIPGAGRLDGAFSEGLSDFLAASITDDAGMGRGFFYTEAPLRDLDPANKEPRWPEDIGEIHKTGIIFGAAMWDLRKALITRLGRATAIPLVNKLFYASVQRASDIPTTLVELLLADDTDGNLANGTPNECEILDVFGQHGLRVVSGVSEAPGAVRSEVAAAMQEVSFTLLGRSPRCSSDVVSSFEVSWAPGTRGLPQTGKVQATRVGTTERWTAQLPLPVFDTMKFMATITFGSTIKLQLPDNAGDQMYSLYEGETIPLLCTTMDTSPFTEGWTGTEGWDWGPASTTGSTDPRGSFSGERFVAMGMGQDYGPDLTYTLNLPTIDVGRYSDVRLQYRRWLAVEDSEFDQATINVNGKVVWRNVSDNRGNDSALHHIDREWRFQDVPLSSRFRGGEMDLSFALTTDGGLEFGGWAIDDLCVVADPNSICGDGRLSGQEECDEGGDNADKPNECRIDCKLAACGDGIVDRGEECDDGDPSDRCAVTCLLNHDESGCCSAGGNPAASALLSLGVLALVMRRRRRR